MGKDFGKIYKDILKLKEISKLQSRLAQRKSDEEFQAYSELDYNDLILKELP